MLVPYEEFIQGRLVALHERKGVAGFLRRGREPATARGRVPAHRREDPLGESGKELVVPQRLEVEVYHGGQISVEATAPGEGTTFRITLDAADTDSS